MNANFDAVRLAIDALDAKTAAASAARSGGRLKLLTVESSDGLSIPLTHQGMPVLWDTQLNTHCLIYPVAGYPAICLPSLLDGYGLAYSDAACQTKVAYNGSGLNPYIEVSRFAPDGGSRHFVVENFSQGELTFVEAAPLGASQTVYMKNSCFTDGGCPCTAQGSYPVAPLIGSLPDSSLARITYQLR